MNKTLALTALAAFADALMPDVSNFKSSFGLGGIAHKQQMGQMDPQYSSSGHSNDGYDDDSGSSRGNHDHSSEYYLDQGLPELSSGGKSKIGGFSKSLAKSFAADPFGLNDDGPTFEQTV